MQLTLAEAILLGSTISRPCIGWGASVNQACALHAAVKAIGKPDFIHGIPNYAAISEAWPFSDVIEVTCPECGIPTQLVHMIYHLNDIHDWTRERIAELVASIEPKPEARAMLGGDPVEIEQRADYVNEKVAAGESESGQ